MNLGEAMVQPGRFNFYRGIESIILFFEKLGS